MVDAVGVEVACHVAEAALPPLAAVAQHLVPVVGGEAPVLAVLGKVIGRRSGLAVEVEVAGLLPYVAAVAGDADGDVTFEEHAARAGVGVDGAELLGENELDEVPEADGRPGGVGAGGAAVPVLLRPLAEVARGKAVAQDAVLGVGFQPLA